MRRIRKGKGHTVEARAGTMKRQEKEEIFTAIDDLTSKLRATVDAVIVMAMSLLTIWLKSLEKPDQPPQQASQIMTVKEVADLMRVDPRAVYKWAKKGELLSLRVGDDLRFDRAEVADYMRRHRKPIEPAPPRVVKFAASPDAAATRNEERNGRTHT